MLLLTQDICNCLKMQRKDAVLQRTWYFWVEINDDGNSRISIISYFLSVNFEFEPDVCTRWHYTLMKSLGFNKGEILMIINWSIYTEIKKCWILDLTSKPTMFFTT